MFESAAKSALFHLLILLGHKYPRVRKAAAEHMYIALMSVDSLDVADEKKDAAMAILVECKW